MKRVTYKFDKEIKTKIGEAQLDFQESVIIAYRNDIYF